MNFLRLDTNLGQKHQQVSASIGILTPISANQEDHKPSISPMTWSFSSQSSVDPSQSSSLASITPPEQPSTPQHRSLPIEYAFNSSHSSFGYVPEPTVRCDFRSGCNTSTVALQSSPGSLDETLDLANRDYHFIPRYTGSSLYRLQTNNVDVMMPACGDFSTALSANLDPSTSGFHDPQPRFTNSVGWGTTAYNSAPIYNQAYRNSNSEPAATGSSSPFFWPLPFQQVLPSSAEVALATTISPCEAMPPVFHESDALGDFDLETKPLGLLSPMSERSSYEDHQEPMSEELGVKREPLTPEPKTAPQWRTFHRDRSHKNIALSLDIKPSRKTRKLARSSMGSFDRGTAMTKRRGRDVKLNISNKTLNGGSVLLIEEEYTKFKAVTHVCKEQCGRGAQCGRGFARVEHLRRHEKTHTGEKNIDCPVGQARCTKRFNRRDNWRDHLKTHLKVSPTRRNELVAHEVLFDTLREKEDPAEAEKTIDTLKKWMEKGHHLNSTGTRSRARL